MDSELRQYLEGMRQDLRGDLEGMKLHLEGMKLDLKVHIDGQIDAVKAHTAGQIDAVEDRLKDVIRTADQDMETKIIGEFWKWSRTSDMRTREALTHAAALGERLLAVEDRVSALERRTAA